jgi:hypothetical protein
MNPAPPNTVTTPMSIEFPPMPAPNARRGGGRRRVVSPGLLQSAARGVNKDAETG